MKLAIIETFTMAINFTIRCTDVLALCCFQLVFFLFSYSISVPGHSILYVCNGLHNQILMIILLLYKTVKRNAFRYSSYTQLVCYNFFVVHSFIFKLEPLHSSTSNARLHHFATRICSTSTQRQHTQTQQKQKQIVNKCMYSNVPHFIFVNVIGIVQFPSFPITFGLCHCKTRAKSNIHTHIYLRHSFLLLVLLFLQSLFSFHSL